MVQTHHILGTLISKSRLLALNLNVSPAGLARFILIEDARLIPLLLYQYKDSTGLIR